MGLNRPGSLELALIGVALMVCLFAGYTTYRIVTRLRLADGSARHAWLGAAGMTLGGGVWVAQLVTRLAIAPRLPSEFDPQLATAALTIATAGSWIGLAILSRGSRLAILAGGLAVAGSIGVASLLSGAAFDGRHLPKLGDDAIRLSALGALMLGVGAVIVVRRLKMGRRTILVALGICCLHLTALAVMSNIPDIMPSDGETTFGIAISLAASGFAVTLLSYGGALFDQHLRDRASIETNRLRRFAEATLEGVVFHTDGLIRDANATFCRMAGFSTNDLVGREVAGLFAPGSRGVIDDMEQGTGTIAEAVLLDADGREHAVDLRGGQLDFGGEILSVLAVKDVAERKEAERQMQLLMQFDALTGLPNRALFRERALQAICDAQVSGASVAILVIGIDRFKAVNDALGHRAGDRLLASVAERIRGALRETDTLARLGGDEFGVIQVAEHQPGAAGFLARRILQSLRRPYSIEAQTISATSSIGVAFYPHEPDSQDAVLSQALLALDRAKQEGRNGICFFDAEADAARQTRHELEHDLSTAIRRGELSVAYQPLFNAKTLEVEGYEALSRWKHPRFGCVPPSEFILIAEEGGMIEDLGRQILQTACAEAASWPNTRRIAVNLSPVQCRDADFPKTVAAILTETGLDAGRLELEVTEGVLIQNPERALSVLRECKELGVRIALDDFGTGYSSLSYLRRFTVDKIKIDRSFVIELGKDAEADAIVNSILALGQALGLDVTAEGVETEAQLAHLRAHGASQVQGYLLGKPTLAAGIETKRNTVAAA